METVAISKSSSADVSRVDKKKSVVTKRHLGPEQGYTFKVDETFKLCRVQTPPEVVVRSGPRPAPHHRARKAAGNQKTKAESGSNQDPAERNTGTQPKLLHAATHDVPDVTERAKDSSTLTTNKVLDQSKTGPAKDSSTSSNAIAEGAACAAIISGNSSDSDGGVQLPPHMDTSNARGIVFGSHADSDAGDNHTASPEPQTIEGVNQVTDGGSDSDPLVWVLDCCGQS